MNGKSVTGNLFIGTLVRKSNFNITNFTGHHDQSWWPWQPYFFCKAPCTSNQHFIPKVNNIRPFTKNFIPVMFLNPITWNSCDMWIFGGCTQSAVWRRSEIVHLLWTQLTFIMRYLRLLSILLLFLFCSPVCALFFNDTSKRAKCLSKYGWFRMQR